MTDDFRCEIPPAERRKYLDFALKLAAESRNCIEQAVSAGFNVSVKADKSMVTEADIETEKVLRKSISQYHANHGIIGEELPRQNPDSPFQWILDPIDGTDQFIEGIPTFGTIISLHYKRLPLVAVVDHPALDTTISAAFEAGVSCNGAPLGQTLSTSTNSERKRIISAKRANYQRIKDEGSLFDQIVASFPNIWIFDNCYSHTCVIRGAADAMIEYNVKLWDISAAQLLTEEAGGCYRLLHSRQQPNAPTVYAALFGNSSLVSEIMAVVSSYHQK